MTAIEQRSSRRDRILMLARLRVEDQAAVHDIRIRDLSAGGLRAQFALPLPEAARVAIEIRNIGWVSGRLAWQETDYIGIRFDGPIDPEKARIAVTGAYTAPPRPPETRQRRL